MVHVLARTEAEVYGREQYSVPTFPLVKGRGYTQGRGNNGDALRGSNSLGEVHVECKSKSSLK